MRNISTVGLSFIRNILKVSLFSFLFVGFSLAVKTVYAQDSNGIWYFGQHAGLDFSTSPPTALTNSQLDTFEGSSVACDKNGKLLFYTDGRTIWDSRHQVMPNGTGLLGHNSSTHSAMIVGHLTKSNLFYIFTCAEAGMNSGFCYSIVDMSLNGGYGDIVPEQKSIQLITPSSEKVTTVLHENGKDIWIISLEANSKKWYSFLLTSSGLQTTPVVSDVGFLFNEGYAQVKSSFNGEMIASCLVLFDSAGLGKDEAAIELYRFNRATGALTALNKTPNIEGAFYYGLEFSENNKYLYCSWTNFYSYASGIDQFDLSTGRIDVSSKKVVVESKSSGMFGALQMGPDKRIYVARVGDEKVSVIETPNMLTPSCNFNDDGVDLHGKQCKWGLPTVFRRTVIEQFMQVSGGCDLVRSFSVKTNKEIKSLLWKFGDGKQSDELSPSHVYSTSGTFTVKLSVVYTDNTIEEEQKKIAVYGVPATAKIQF